MARCIIKGYLPQLLHDFLHVSLIFLVDVKPTSKHLLKRLHLSSQLSAQKLQFWIHLQPSGISSVQSTMKCNHNYQLSNFYNIKIILFFCWKYRDIQSVPAVACPSELADTNVAKFTITIISAAVSFISRGNGTAIGLDLDHFRTCSVTNWRYDVTDITRRTATLHSA